MCPTINFRQNHVLTLTCKTNASKMTTQHGGADFRQIFGQHTAAQISASTRRRRFRPAHGDTDAAPKISREKNLRAEGPQIFFETVSVEQGFMTEKVCFMTEKVCFMTKKGATFNKGQRVSLTEQETGSEIPRVTSEMP